MALNLNFQDTGWYASDKEGPAFVERMDEAVASLAAKGIVDPSRIGIVGFSHAGYVAFYAATHAKRTRLAAAHCIYLTTFSYPHLHDVAIGLERDLYETLNGNGQSVWQDPAASWLRMTFYSAHRSWRRRPCSFIGQFRSKPGFRDNLGWCSGGNSSTLVEPASFRFRVHAHRDSSAYASPAAPGRHGPDSRLDGILVDACREPGSEKAMQNARWKMIRDRMQLPGVVSVMCKFRKLAPGLSCTSTTTERLLDCTNNIVAPQAEQIAAALTANAVPVESPGDRSLHNVRLSTPYAVEYVSRVQWLAYYVMVVLRSPLPAMPADPVDPLDGVKAVLNARAMTASCTPDISRNQIFIWPEVFSIESVSAAIESLTASTLRSTCSMRSFPVCRLSFHPIEYSSADSRPWFLTRQSFFNHWGLRFHGSGNAIRSPASAAFNKRTDISTQMAAGHSTGYNKRLH